MVPWMLPAIRCAVGCHYLGCSAGVFSQPQCCLSVCSPAMLPVKELQPGMLRNGS